MAFIWGGSRTIVSRPYTCGFCGNSLASNIGYVAGLNGGNHVQRHIYICHFCDKPTYIDEGGTQTPGAAFGNAVSKIESVEVAKLYEEARNCMKVNAFTAASLCCRKLLMNIAVAKGAEQGLSFAQYVDFFDTKGITPKDSKEWVEHIRNKGNEATHEISSISREDAEDLINFSEMLLKIIYEFPSRVRTKNAKTT